MRRNVGFVSVAIATLALGIGANTAIFSVVEAVLFRALPYEQPDRLVAVWNRWDGSEAAALSDPEYLDYAEQSRTLTMAAAAGGAVNLLGPAGDAERVDAAFVTANALDVLGVAPALGRGFRAEDGTRGAPGVVLLTDGIWRRMFGADRGVIGRSAIVNGTPRIIIGVLRAGFLLPSEIAAISRVDVLLPLQLDAAAARNRRGGHYLQAFARLNGGATLEAASDEMDAIIARLIQQYPDDHDQGNFGIVVGPLREDLLGDSRPLLLILAGAVGLVLLLACANVANLLLARGESRRRELAVRTALGASRFRVIRQLLTESFVLSLGGAAAGLVVAYWCQRLILAVGGSSLPRIDTVSLDGPVLAFAGALAMVTSMLFGLVPALQVSYGGPRGVDRVNDALKDGARGTDAGRTRIRRALLVCQVTFAMVLLVGSGLLVKGFVRLTATPSGLDPDGVLTTRLSLPAARYPGRSEVASFYRRLLERVRTIPGVRIAGAASGLPLAVGSGDWSFDIEGRPRNGSRYPGAADWFVVTPGYFESLRIPLRRGRLPLSSDSESAPEVIFINETTARTLFPDRDPVGRRIRLSRTTGPEQPWRTIAGVVGDVRHRGLDSPARPEMFIPYEQFLHFSAAAQARAMSLVVRTEGEPLALVGAVRAELRALDREVPAAAVRSMESVVSESVADRRLNAILIGAFGLISLALAAVGLYGVMAFHVAQRTREMGVRIAIGASRASVLALVVGEGVRVVCAGAALGFVASLLLTGWMSALLYDVEPRDLSMFALACAVLVITGTLASYLPARRATRIDPVRALRAD
jgi:putative ABC transport system permease protein